MQDPLPLLRVATHFVRDAVVITDSSARILMLNPAAESMTGWAEAEAIGQPIEQIVALFNSVLSENGTESPIQNPAYAVLGHSASLEGSDRALLIGKGGRRIAVQFAASPVPASPVTEAGGVVSGSVLVLHDVSEALHLAERMAYQAQHDSLTGLPNRILLVDRLEQATKLADRMGEQLAVIFVDIDDFLRINAAHSRAVADALLKEVAYRLTGALRESDTVCRLGADEFVLLLSGVKSLEVVESLAAKLLAEIARPYAVNGQTIQTSCSIGISLYPRDASDAATLMRLADGALHQAKATGRSQFLFAHADQAKTLVK